MKFKVGDTVRIRGGQDEWVIWDIDQLLCYLMLGKICVRACLDDIELVRRKKECKHEMEEIKGASHMIKCVHCAGYIEKPLGWVDPKKKKVERWLWVYKNSLSMFTREKWMTEEEAKSHKFVPEYLELIGKDPNCKEPLITEE